MIVLFVHFLQGEKKQIGEAFNEEKALKILQLMEETPIVN